MNNKTNFKKKKQKSLAMKIVAAIFVLALIGGIITFAFSNGFLRDRNEENLISLEGYIVDQKDLYGIELDVKDDGAIKIKGDTKENVDFLIQSVELEAGTYTLSGIEDPNLGIITLNARYGNGGVAYAGDTSATFTLSEKTTVSIYLSVVESEEGISYVNRTIRPCLVEGQTAGDFYK